MALRHTNPVKPRGEGTGEIWARAPYNFVPLPERVVLAQPDLPGHDVYAPGTESGWIDCELETCAPLYIRGMLTEAQFRDFGEKRPDEMNETEKAAHAAFFSASSERIEGLPLPQIPGSSLRGMVRALVEIAAHARMRWVADSPTFTFRAVAAARDDPLRQPYDEAIGRYGANVRAGYLKQEGDHWFIEPAFTPQERGLSERGGYLKVKERVIGARAIPGFRRLDSTNYKPGYFEVEFDAENRRGRSGAYVAVTDIVARSERPTHQHLGTLVCSGNMKESDSKRSTRRRNHALVLERNLRAQPLRLAPQTVRDYLAGMSPYQQTELWGGSQGCLKHGAPIFCVAEGRTVLAFGHSPNFRIPARLLGGTRAATPRDFVPDALTSGAAPDLVEAIFGWVQEAEGELEGQRAGRVSFSDATFVEARHGVWLRTEPITPHVLSGPKPTTFQHYLVQDRSQGHDPDDKASLAHYGSSPKTTEIRGHKLYWHKGAEPDIEASPSERQHPSQLTQMVPLKPGIRFRFRVHFENLRPEELGALLWALSLPGEPERTYRHKLGMGKPLGMGAVAIACTLTLVDRQARYARLFEGQGWAQASDAADPAPYVDAFERYVLDRLGSQVGRLCERERIRMLLTMLEWPGPDPEVTRYMEIERGQEGLNEYKQRPVLPDPIAVVPGEPVRLPQREHPPTTQRQSAAQQQARPRDQAAGPQTGRVKWFNDSKGYGFITPDGGGQDVFVHYTGIVGEGRVSLRQGQRVTFQVRQGMKGPEAREVRAID